MTRTPRQSITGGKPLLTPDPHAAPTTLNPRSEPAHVGEAAHTAVTHWEAVETKGRAATS